MKSEYFYEWSYRMIHHGGSKSKWTAWFEGQIQLDYMFNQKHRYETLEWKQVFCAKTIYEGENGKSVMEKVW